MADISTRMSVSGLGQYKSAMSQAQASVKQLDSALKRNEAQLKVTGDKEQYMADKARLLNQRMQSQKAYAQQAEAALKTMESQGVSKVSKAYQDMLTKLNQAQEGMLNTQNELNNLTEAEQRASSGADALTASVNGISKKISLDQVISGIDRITNGIESAAKKTAELGKQMWDTIMDSARWADDTATMASMLEITVEEYQRLSAVAATSAETSVEAWVTAKQKLAQNMVNGGDSVQAIFDKLGVKTKRAAGVIKKNSEEITQFEYADTEDVIWAVGDALLNWGDATERAAWANTLFGRNWKELLPEFKMGREEFERLKGSVDVVSGENIEDMAALNDKVIEVTQKFEVLKNTVIAEIAPQLTAVAGTISDLLSNLNKYLESDDGQELLKNLGDAVGALFGDLANLDPDKAVESLTTVFTKLTDGLKWIADNQGKIKAGLGAVALGFAGLEVSKGVLTALQMIAALKGVSIGGTAAAAGGGLLGGVATWLGNKWTGFTNWLGGAWNGAAIGDWFMNNTYTGQVTRNTGNLIEGVKAGVEQGIKDVQTNASNFFGDWKGVFNQIFGGGGSEKSFGSGVKVEWEEGGAPEDTILYRRGQGEPLNIPVKAEVLEGTDVDLAAQIGVVDVPARLVLSGAGYGGSTGGGTFDLLRDIGSGFRGLFGHHANGLWSVPFDGYPAILHKGERVVPAREVGSRTFSSNLYVNNMNMSSGQDAEGLASAIAARNRETMRGFGV